MPPSFLLASASAAAGAEPHPILILPFALMLTAIAAMPFINLHWWEKNLPFVAMGLGMFSVVYYLVANPDPSRLLHVALEYLSFISLIGSLFVVAGGIWISVKGQSTPAKNCLFLAIGSVLSNIIGTTGASMLLIRPWIRSNKYRITGFHIVFFIFIISNVSGVLTPIGDPPLFLGYLSKVPFWWTMENLWMEWLLGVSALIGIFYIFDALNFRQASKEIRRKETREEEWSFRGKRNVIFLAVILYSVFMPTPQRELLMLGAAVGSYIFTPKGVHEGNQFNFTPIREVAWLFLGIFATMIPALHYLQANASGLGIDTPMKFFWITGMLSAFLDNAPTYLTFLTTSVSSHFDPVDGHRLVVGNAADMLVNISLSPLELVAISLGAVFFGALTYIGNGPNFMVKSIADQSKVHVPGFFGYMLRFSLPILIPLYAIIGWIFLRSP